MIIFCIFKMIQYSSIIFNSFIIVFFLKLIITNINLRCVCLNLFKRNNIKYFICNDIFCSLFLNSNLNCFRKLKSSIDLFNCFVFFAFIYFMSHYYFFIRINSIRITELSHSKRISNIYSPKVYLVYNQISRRNLKIL